MFASRDPSHRIIKAASNVVMGLATRLTPNFSHASFLKIPAEPDGESAGSCFLSIPCHPSSLLLSSVLDIYSDYIFNSL